MSENIIINLLKSENASSFSEGNIIHATEFLTVKNHIDDLIDLAKADESKENLHKAITVLGSRGSGKTSFLLNIRDYYKTNSDVSVLPIIDPTLIEEKGHVFLNVLSAISEVINKKLDEDVFNLEYNQQVKRQWHNKLMNLAHGIPSIDGIGSNNSDNWMDPEFVMDTGLAAVSASRNLMQNFNDLLDFSAQILKKSVFLLIFDDIDVDSSKGWAVLECIRKYFTSSKLIILLSGDMNLYSTVIRQKKWMNFGREILKYEGVEQRTGDTSNKINRFNDMVVELSSQYMLKIMPPKYRIHLTTISEKKRISRDISINVSHPALEREESLDKVYNRILKKFGIVNPTQQEVYRTFLLSLPLRTQIQFLIKKIDDKNRDYNSIIDIFLAELQEKNVDTYTSKHSSKFINSIILDLLISNHRLLDVY
ncbi:P-loop NTPase fold protein [Chryseobacterium sp. 2TAF14]|uniref:P-loop NTPase fold protein n=1 Tax=Chryseobacterium sp. 2TAF14 TaxID=3233007 RepID=UPI003F8F3EE4